MGKMIISVEAQLKRREMSEKKVQWIKCFCAISVISSNNPAKARLGSIRP